MSKEIPKSHDSAPPVSASEIPPVHDKSQVLTVINQPLSIDQPSAGKQQTNSLAIASLIATFVVPIVGFVLGLIALSQIKKSGEDGRGMALAAVVINIFGFVMIIMLVIIASIVGPVD